MEHKKCRYRIIKSDASQPYHFVLVNSDDQILITSENYTTKASALNGIESVKENGHNRQNFELLTAQDGHLYFVLKAKNGEIIATSQMYKSEEAREAELQDVIKCAKHADIEDTTLSSGPVVSNNAQRSESNKRYA